MALLDLPAELFENVIHCYVSAVGVEEAWRNRIVCKTFKGYIVRDIFKKQPEGAFYRPKKYGRGNQPTTFGSKNLGTIIACRIGNIPISLYGFRDPLPNFVNAIAGELIHAAGEQDTVGRRRAYAPLITTRLAETYAYFWNKITDKDKNRAFQDVKKDLAGYGNVDRVAAAAIVGNIAALRAFAVNNPDDLWSRSTLFGHPLVVAAQKGHLLLAKAIAKARFSGAVEWYMPWTWLLAIDAALMKGHFETAIFLLRCLAIEMRHSGLQGLSGCLARGAPKGHYEDWMRWAVSSGKAAVVSALLGVPHNGVIAIHVQGLKLAITKHYWDIARLFFDRGFLDIDQNIFGDCPLSLAIKQGSIDFVEYLLLSGANPNGPSELVEDPHYVAMNEGHSGIVALLVRWGADPQMPDNSKATIWANKHLRPKKRPNPIYGHLVSCNELFQGVPDLVPKPNKVPTTSLTAAEPTIKAITDAANLPDDEGDTQMLDSPAQDCTTNDDEAAEHVGQITAKTGTVTETELTSSQANILPNSL